MLKLFWFSRLTHGSRYGFTSCVRVIIEPRYFRKPSRLLRRQLPWLTVLFLEEKQHGMKILKGMLSCPPLCLGKVFSTDRFRFIRQCCYTQSIVYFHVYFRLFRCTSTLYASTRQPLVYDSSSQFSCKLVQLRS